MREARLTSMNDIVHDLLEIMRPSLDRPYALFGHSMGALTAYLITCRLAEEKLRLPSHLFISGKGPPHLISREAQWHSLPLDIFKIKLAELGGSPPALLDDQELMAYFAPIIRDDMRTIAEYLHRPLPPFDVPVTVMIGTSENTTLTEAAGWEVVTTSRFKVQQYEGGHFFLFDHVEEICELINSTLAAD